MSWGSKVTLMLPTLGLFGASLAMTVGSPIMWLLEWTWGLALFAAVLSAVRLINERRWVRAVRKGKA
jgi:hypothetical protein